jgi:hypothetical protein
MIEKKAFNTLIEYSNISLNIFYFIPNTIIYLNWKSGVTMGYVGMELIFNYLVHIFFITSLFSILRGSLKKIFLVFTMLLLVISFLFGYKIIDYMIIIPAIGYCLLYFNIYISKTIQNCSFFMFNLIGLIISLIWLIFDIKMF